MLDVAAASIPPPPNQPLPIEPAVDAVIDRQTAVDALTLREAIGARRVAVRVDQELGVVVFNYTHLAQLAWQWSDTLKTCRGLGLDLRTGAIIFRGPRKFFNLGQGGSGVCNTPLPGIPERTEKLDGALGLGFRKNGELWVATRGSVRSAIAADATRILRARHPEARWPDGFTPFFEVITPLTRKIVDYGDREELVLLGLIENASGREMRHWDVAHFAGIGGFRHVELLKGSREELLAAQEGNSEGFVESYWGPDNQVYRMKVKFDTYTRSAAFLRRYTPLRVWKDVVEGRDLADVLPAMPLPVLESFARQCGRLVERFQAIDGEVDALLETQFPPAFHSVELNRPEHKADRGRLLGSLTAASAGLGWIAFLKAIGKQHQVNGKVICAEWEWQIWKRLRPKNNNPYRREE